MRFVRIWGGDFCVGGTDCDDEIGAVSCGGAGLEWQSFISNSSVFHTELIEPWNQFHLVKRIKCSSDGRDILWDSEESSHLKDRDLDGCIICTEVYRRTVCCLGSYCIRVLPIARSLVLVLFRLWFLVSVIICLFS